MQTETGRMSRVNSALLTRQAIRNPIAAILATVALCSGVCVPVIAQEPLERNDEGELQEVTVTGSRIQQRADYVSPNLIMTIEATDLQNLGIVSISEAIDSFCSPATRRSNLRRQRPEPSASSSLPPRGVCAPCS